MTALARLYAAVLSWLTDGAWADTEPNDCSDDEHLAWLRSLKGDE